MTRWQDRQLRARRWWDDRGPTVLASAAVATWALIVTCLLKYLLAR